MRSTNTHKLLICRCIFGVFDAATVPRQHNSRVTVTPIEAVQVVGAIVLLTWAALALWSVYQMTTLAIEVRRDAS